MLGYTVYRTVNQLNGMFYIGVHKTANPNDDYLGSGKRLRYAIKKYGVENFVKEVLYSFETKEEAYSKEKELVTEDVLDSGNCYNLKLGGEGGWDFINSSQKEDHIKRNRIVLLSYNNSPMVAKSRAKGLDKIACLRKMKIIKSPFSNTDLQKEMHKRSQSIESSQKRVQTMKLTQFQTGAKNSQFGSMWITDGVSNKKIKKDQEIPEGWRSGRINKN